jgi:hypothetical protein
MNVLETFYILFKSDADKAAAGLDKVDDAADKVEKSLKGADKATKGTATSAAAAAASTGRLSAVTATADANAKRLATSFMSVARAAAAPLLGLLSVGAVTNIATGRAQQIRELDQFSAKLNSTIGDVDAFQRSVQQLGGEGSQALDSLVKIGEKVNEAFADSESGARKDFEAWGLAFKDTEGQALGATEAMLALAGSLEGVSKAEGLARIKRLGIEDAATIELLLKGRKEVERFITTQKEMGVVTEEQARITGEYYEALGGLGNQLTSVGNNIASAFLPGITSGLEMLGRLLDWVTDNQTLVEGFFIGVAGAVTAYFLPAMAKAALATLAATWPFLLIAGAIALVGAAFALAYEDVRAFLDGQPSLIGELVAKYEWMGESITAIGNLFNWLGEQWTEFAAKFEREKARFAALWEYLKEQVDGAGEWFAELGEKWGQFVGQFDDARQVIGAFWSWLVEKFEGFLNALSNSRESVREFSVFLTEGMASAGEAVAALAGFFSGALTSAVQGVINLVSTLIENIRAGAAAIMALAGLNPSAGLPRDQQPAAQAGAAFGAGVIKPPGAEPGNDNAYGGQSAPGGFATGRSMLNGAANAPQGLATPANVNNTSTVSVGEVNVHTQATDAEGMARAARGALSRELAGTAAAFDDGVDR